MTKFVVCILAIFTAVPVAFGQIDMFSFHARYGVPFDRETFVVRPGIEMVVDYGPSKQVCRIQLPSGMQIVGTVLPGVIAKQQIDEVLDEVVPPSFRGKEVSRVMQRLGAISSSLIEYEHVDISETKNAAVGSGITVTFKDPACPKKMAP